ncbi:MAG: F0F1 ATP synthase subunit A [Alphaproteobacteria bacterium]
MATQMANPLEQFTVQPVFALPKLMGYDVGLTNSSLGMLIAVVLAVLFYAVALRKKSMVPGRLQSLGEMTYEFVHGFFRENAGGHAEHYFPFIFTLFLFILFMNLVGMVPFSFTPTSHIIITFGMAIVVFLGVTLIGIAKKGPIGFLKHFIPPGVPLWMAPLLLVIEFISYCVRPFSLSIRLAANMFAGHTLMAVIAGFIVPLGIFGLLPGAFLVGFTAVEIFVAILQAYVFALLSSIYLGEALSDHH